MGSTLTHGVYLPAEGERNCYDGLASNWNILDGAVGTIADHTTALAGKAPAVHTHTKSDITDFPAYGNTAGTICEGNDSRLSDARTPVAHTHTKSDVTDLFNSANTWTADNTFSGTNSFTAANINIKSNNFSLGDTVSSNQVKRFQWYDASNNRYACIAVNYATDKSVWVDLPLRTKNTEGTSFVDKGIRFQVKPDNTSAFLPVTNSVTDLGTSTNKWKTLNGINPGALSFPDYNNVLDVTSEIPIASLDGNTQININDYLADKTGWLSIVIDDTAGNSIIVTQGESGGATAFNNSRTFHTGAQSNGYISVFFPIIAGTSKIAFIKAASLIQMRFYYCLGNV